MKLLDEPLVGGAPGTPVPVRPGKVTLVGAGPGDPDLLTVKAARALRHARLVLYDHLVSREVLRLVPEDADLICVGKQSGHHTLPQGSIVELMLRLARSGRPVVRLKGGDPYIFGRGGEEAQALAAAGIAFEVVPGISAAQAAAAGAGMPLTHRDHAHSVVFATGHSRHDVRHAMPGDAPGRAGGIDLDWAGLVRAKQTVVIYMGVGNLPVLCAQFIAHGMSPDMPAALVERASCPGQRSVVGTVQGLPALAAAHRIEPPALLIVGTVVSLHRELCGAASACRTVTS